MNIYILRHAIAVDLPAGSRLKDADRALTAEGRRKLRACARAMGQMDLRFDLVLSSPYLRARQTAELVAECLRLRQEPRLAEALAPAGEPGEVVTLLASCKATDVLLVGHEPNLSQLISFLLLRHTRLPLTLKKGGLCKLSAESVRPGACALEWLLTPKLMALMK